MNFNLNLALKFLERNNVYTIDIVVDRKLDERETIHQFRDH